MKKLMIYLSLAFLIGFMAPGTGLSQELSTDEVMKELRQLKERLNRLEEGLTEKDQEIKRLKAKLPAESAEGFTPGAEEKKWTDRIGLSGTVEVEFGNEHHDLLDPANSFLRSTTQSHDITLAKVELGVDADINKYTKGFVLLKNTPSDGLFVDEATIIIGDTPETYELYFKGGLYCPSFGNFNSYMVSDALTQQVFETCQSAAEVGYGGDWFSANAGLFKGDVQKDFNTEDRINGYFAGGNFHNPEGILGDLYLTIGASWLSNVADSDTLAGDDGTADINGDGIDNDLNDYVDGIAGYLVVDYKQFSFGAEYITGTDEFELGEMAYALDRNGVARKTEPAAWNFGLAYKPIESLQLSVRYEGTDDMFGLFPESQYGGTVAWEFLESTTLSAEYLHGEFEASNRNSGGMVEDERDLFTVNLAIGF